jgi:hypothetical protein
VDAEIVRRAQINTAEIKVMEEAVSSFLSRKLLRILIQSGLSAEDRRAVVGSVSIKVCKRFTCSASAYGFWLGLSKIFWKLRRAKLWMRFDNYQRLLMA